MPSRRRLLACLPLLLAPGALAAAAGPGLALTTILDGEAMLLRGTGKTLLAAGVPLLADDMIEVSEKAGSLLRLEFSDGVKLDLGPASRLLLAPRLAGERGRARAYLLNGWAKVTVPPKTPPAALLTPLFDAPAIAANLVLALLPEGAQAFAESGEAALRFARPDMPALTLKPNEWMHLDPAGQKPAVSPRPGPQFIQQVPRAFLDPLPSRAALFAGREREPGRSADPLAYADAQPWIDAAEPALRRLALARWRALARNGPFRAGLLSGLKAHPKWQPVLFPPAPAAKP